MALIFDKVPTIISTEYSDYNDLFSVENAVKFPEYTGINDHAIN